MMISLPCSSLSPNTARIPALSSARLRRTSRSLIVSFVAARFDACFLDQFVRGEIGQIVERLDARLAEHTSIASVSTRQFGQRIFDTQFAAFGAICFFAAIQSFLRTALQFFGQLFVVKPSIPAISSGST